MSNRRGVVTSFIRGGQVIQHYIGMAKEVFATILIFGGIGFVGTFSVIIYYFADFDGFRMWINYLQAYLIVEWKGTPNDTIWFLHEGLQGIGVKAGLVYYDPETREIADSFFNVLGISILCSMVVLAVISYLILRFLLEKGHDFNKDKHIRGNQLVSEKELKDDLSKRVRRSKDLSAGNLKIGSIELPFEWETHNLMMIGGPGTGKSQLYFANLETIRKVKSKVIVNDRSGTFVEKFYRKDKDIILNPLDHRTAQWSLFSEFRYEHQFQLISNILFPSTKSGDPFWYEAPRLIFTALALQESGRQTPSAYNLVNRVLTCDVEELIEMCRNTYARSVMEKKLIKQAQTLRSIVATKAKFFTLFDDSKGGGFSLREWILDKDTEGTIFITSNREMEAYLKPIITIWLELASSTVLSTDEDIKRRIYLWFDELHTLGKIESLADTLADIRKHGGSAWLSFQGYCQGKEIYGDDGFEALSASCATNIFLRANNYKCAKWMSEQLGKSDKYEAQESLSYGVERVRDGVNMSDHRNTRELVLPTEILNLDDLHGYLRVGKGMPVASFEQKYVPRTKLNDAFVINAAQFISHSDLKERMRHSWEGHHESDDDVDISRNEIHLDEVFPVDNIPLSNYENDFEVQDIGSAYSKDDDDYILEGIESEDR